MTSGTIPHTHAILERLAAELTARQYDTWTLHHLHGMNPREIARRLNLNQSTIREHLEAADRRVARITWEGDWPWT